MERKSLPFAAPKGKYLWSCVFINKESRGKDLGKTQQKGALLCPWSSSALIRRGFFGMDHFMAHFRRKLQLHCMY